MATLKELQADLREGLLKTKAASIGGPRRGTPGREIGIPLQAYTSGQRYITADHRAWLCIQSGIPGEWVEYERSVLSDRGIHPDAPLRDIPGGTLGLHRGDIGERVALADGRTVVCTKAGRPGEWAVCESPERHGASVDPIEMGIRLGVHCVKGDKHMPTPRTTIVCVESGTPGKWAWLEK